jgi:hypothetical protein
MALKPFNSIGGFSVGETPSNVILANGDITTTNITTTGVANLNAVGNVKISGGTAGQVLSTDGAGNLTFVTTATSGSIFNGTSNVAIPVANGNVIAAVAGNTILTVTIAGANLVGNLSVGGILTDNIYHANGQPFDLQQPAGSNNQIQFNESNNFAASANFTFNPTTNVLDVTGNIIGANIYANSGIIGAQTLKGEGGNISNIQGANVSGTVSSATTAGTVTTNAQSNITSVGTLTDLTVGNATSNTVFGNGTINATGNITAANFIGNVQGNISGNIVAPGSNTEVVFNNAGNLGASNAFSFNNSSNVLTVVGNVSATNFIGNGAALTAIAGANVTGQVGNALVAGTVYTNAQPNITSVGTLTSLAVTGNTTTGNLSATGDVSGATLTGTLTTAAQPNVTSVGTLTDLTVTGNIQTSANLVTDLIVGRTTSVSISATGANSNVFLKPTGTGTVDVWGARISNVATPTASTDAATKQYVDDVAQGLHTHDSCNAATSTTLATSSGGTVTYNNGTAGVGATLTTTGTYTTIDGVTLSNGMRILVKNEANAAHNGIYDRTSSTVLTRSSDFDTPAEMAGGDYTFVTAGTLYDNTGWVMVDVVTTVGTSPVDWVQFSGAGTYTAGTGLNLNGNQFNISNTAVTAGAYGNGDSVSTFTVNAQGQLTAAANVAITANAANLTGTTLAATIVNSSLTSVGTLTALSVTGNISGGNANLGNLATANFFAGTLTTAAQPNITSVGTLTSLSVTGNVSAGNVSGTTGAFTNVSGNGSALTAITGANVTGQVANALVAGTVYTAAQPNITSVGTLTSLSVTGNISGGNVSATSANLTTANVTGNVIIGSTTLTAGTVTTTATTPAQTIASFPVSGTTGIEYLVKGVDAAGSKYSVAKVVAVTNGTDVDYTVFATVNIGTVTGSSLQVVVDTGNLKLQVTPATSNSTVWTTQYNLV